MPGPTTLVTLPDGRVLACDDVGDPQGRVVVYVHGTPDTRLARHPDDDVAARLGVRLVAVDRPGFGHSTPHPAGTVGSFADDVAHLLDTLGVPRAAVLAWSAGAVPALALAARHPDRVTHVTVAAGVVPFAAYAEPGVLDGADPSRHVFAELAAEMGAEGVAAELAPYLVPDPPTVEAAVEQLRHGHDQVRLAELESVPGAIDAMAAAMVDSVRGGLAGLVRDIELAVLPPDVDLAAVAAPVRLVYGELDTAAPPSYGRWFERNLPRATLTVLAGAGHCFPIPRWAELLSTPG